MSSPFEAEAKIRLTFEDDASLEVDDSVKQINKAYKRMRDEQRSVGRAFELSNRTFVQTARAISVIGNVANRVVNVIQAYNIQQIRNADAARNVRDAHRNLNDAIAEYGVNSRQAIEAAEDLQEALEDQKKTAFDSAINYIFIATTIAGMASTITTKAIPALTRLRDMIRGGQPKATTTKTSPPVPSQTKTTTPKTNAKIGGRVGSVVGGIAAGVGSAALYLAQLMGEQTAGEEDLPGGIEQLQKIGKDVQTKIINIYNNIMSPTPNEMVEKVNNATKNAMTYGG